MNEINELQVTSPKLCSPSRQSYTHLLHLRAYFQAKATPRLADHPINASGAKASSYRQYKSLLTARCWRRSTFDPCAGILLTHAPALRTVASIAIARI